MPRTPGRRRAVAPALTALAAVAVLAAPAAAQSLPGGRAYELVSSAEEESNEVIAGARSTADGNAVAYASSASYPGQMPTVFLQRGWVARRGATGWTTTSVAPPVGAQHPSVLDATAVADFSSDLRTSYVNAFAAGLASGDQNMAHDAYAGDGQTTTWLTPALTLPDVDTSTSAWYGALSADDETVVVESTKPLTTQAQSAGVTQGVYAIRDGQRTLVSVLPNGTPAVSATLGNGAADRIKSSEDGSAPERRSVSADGTRIVFSTKTAPAQVYVWKDGAPSELVSRDEGTGDPAPTGATYQSASADGTRVVFLSDDDLTGEADAGPGSLYRYDTATDELDLLSPGRAGGAGVLGVVDTSPDAGRVWFVAQGVLDTGATDGANNLYVADAGGVRFVATLAAAPDEPRVWSATMGEDHHEAKASPDGRSLLFLSLAPINGYVTGGQMQLYRHDAVTDTLTCLSCRPGTGPATGAARFSNRWNGVYGGYSTPRSFTDDGEQVFFETSERLVAADTDTKWDVYVTDGTTPTLLSVGADDDVFLVDSAADGGTVFVRTRSSLLPEDDDPGYADVYALRPGGGFPPPEGPRTPCEGEACRGPRTPVPAAPVPASAHHTGPGNEAPAPPPSRTARKVTVRRLTAAQLRTLARTGRGTVRVTLAAAGTVRVTARAKVGGRQRTIASARRTLTRAGTASVALRLSATARRALRRGDRLDVRLTVAAGGATTTTTFVLRRTGGTR